MDPQDTVFSTMKVAANRADWKDGWLVLPFGEGWRSRIVEAKTWVGIKNAVVLLHKMGFVRVDVLAPQGDNGRDRGFRVFKDVKESDLE